MLVGGLEHFLFFHILGIIILTDFHIFRGVGIPPTSMLFPQFYVEYPHLWDEIWTNSWDGGYDWVLSSKSLPSSP